MAIQLPDASDDCRTCEYCNAHVTPEFRRTYGTDDHRALRCPECDSWARIMRGSARKGDVDHPDPQVEPNRNGGRELRQKVATDGGEKA